MANKMDIATTSDLEVTITRDFDAPRQLVWDAHTKPDLLRRWMLGPPGWSMPVCEVDLRVGGAYRYVWRQEDGTEMGMGGTFREVVEPERIVNTQLFDQDWTGGETVGTLVLIEADGRTHMTNTILYASRAARDGALSTGMTEGMEQGYAGLDRLLAGI